MVNLSDKEIVHNLMHQHDLDATLRYLYRAYYTSLGHYVVANAGEWTDAEDIFQEVMISFVRLVQEGRFRGESSIKTFLYALNRNIWLNELKRRGRALAREERYGAEGETEEPGIVQAIEHRQATSQLMGIVDSLGEACKKILVLFYYENRSMKEILAELPYENEQVVRNKKHKCLKKLEGMIRDNRQVYQQLKNILT